MNRTRGIVIAIVAGLLLLFLTLYLILSGIRNRAHQTASDSFALIPTDARAILHTQNLALFTNALRKSQHINPQLEDLLNLQSSFVFLDDLDSIIRRDPALLAIWNQSPALVSIHGSHKTQISYLFNLRLARGVNQPEILDFIRRNFLDTSWSSAGHLDAEIFSGRLNNGQTINLSFFRGALLLSTHAPLLRQGISQSYAQNGFHNDHRFLPVRQAAGHLSDNLFIDGSRLEDLLPVSARQNPLMPFQINKLMGWLGWDISYQADQILLHGFSSPLFPAQGFNSILLDQNIIETSIFQHIPLNTSALFYLGGDQYWRIGEAFRQWNPNTEKQQSQQQKAKRLSDILSLPPDSVADFWLGEACSFVLPNDTLPLLLLKVLPEKDFTTHPQLGLFLREIPGDSQSETPKIYQVLLPGFISTLTQGLFDTDYDLLAFTGEYMMAAHAPDQLQNYFTLAASKSFEEHPVYQSVHNDLRPDFNLLLYYDLADLLPRNSSAPTDRGGKHSAPHSGSFALQMFRAPGQLIFTNAMLKQGPQQQLPARILWEVNTEGNIVLGPVAVKNHLDGSTEYILQDDQHILYLVSDQGILLWKKEISGPIISEIFQVDLLRNGRLQYVFNTRNYLHLFDRNGQYVRGFPTRFPAPASAGIALFDYDNNKNYRIVFPTEDRRILNTSLRGTPTSGWEYKRSAYIIQKPLQHIRLEGKDYIFATDTTGVLEILNRRGISRIQTRQPLKVSVTNRIFSADGPLYPHFMVSAPDGTLYDMQSSGKIAPLVVDTFSQDHVFLYDAIASKPNQKNFIFWDQGQLQVYEHSGRLLFAIHTGNIAAETLRIFHLKETRLLGYTDMENQKIVLINKEGKILPSFPIPGNTAFILQATANHQEAYITVGLENKLIKQKVIITSEETR